MKVSVLSGTNLRGSVRVFPVLEMFGMVTPNIWLLTIAPDFHQVWHHRHRASEFSQISVSPKYSEKEQEAGAFAPTGVIAIQTSGAQEDHEMFLASCRRKSPGVCQRGKASRGQCSWLIFRKEWSTV